MFKLTTIPGDVMALPVVVLVGAEERQSSDCSSLWSIIYLLNPSSSGDRCIILFACGHIGDRSMLDPCWMQFVIHV